MGDRIPRGDPGHELANPGIDAVISLKVERLRKPNRTRFDIASEQSGLQRGVTSLDNVVDRVQMQKLAHRAKIRSVTFGGPGYNSSVVFRDPRAEFERIFSARGGEFPIEGVPDDLQFLFTDAPAYASGGLAQAQTPSADPFPFYIGYVAHPTFNAAAADTSAGGLVGIHAHIPYALLAACLAYVDRCAPGEDIPDLRSAAPPTFADWAGFDWADWPPYLYDRIEAVLGGPDGDRRLQFAFQLHVLGALYVTMHEAMHLTLGHAAWYQRFLGEPVMMEFSPDRARVATRESQAAEYLADINTAGGLVEVATRDLGGDRLLATRWLVQAISIVLHLLPPSFRSDDAFGRHRSHPHPFVRMQWINSLLLTRVPEESAQPAVMAPFAHATVTLDGLSGGRDGWLEVNKRNMSGPRLLTDALLRRNARHANALQPLFWTQAPHYPGFHQGFPIGGCEHGPTAPLDAEPSPPSPGP